MGPDDVESIRSELDVFDVACEDDMVLEKMVEQCMCHRLKSDGIVLEWVAFSTTKGGVKLSLDSLERFEHEVLNKKVKSRPSFSKKEETLSKTRDVNSLHDLIKAEEEEENLLDSYSTPAKGSQKRAPDHTRTAALQEGRACSAQPRQLLSPASFSPSVTPSQKYSARGGRGEVVSTYGTAQSAQWTGQRAQGPIRVELLEGPEQSLVSSYKFMFQRLRDIRNVLTERMDELGEELRVHFNIEEFSPVSMPAQDSVTVLGQVCCDGNGKLNSQSVLLEAGPDQGGRQVPVDLSELREFSLFPGQVVVMEG